MSMLAKLAEDYPNSPAEVRLKAALLFAGVKYHPCLPEAATWAFPNYMPYTLPPGVPAVNDQRVVALPYLLRMADDTQVRIRIKEDSPFEIRPDDGPHGFGIYEDDVPVALTTFEPRWPWADLLVADGTPMPATGLSQHGEMLVLNVAPGCEFFVAPRDNGKGTENLSCKFCLYGLPDKRMEPLGQQLRVINVPSVTLDRVVEACAHPETHAHQLYLVGGSMLDMAAEGERFVRIAERLAKAGLTKRYYVAAGTGAIPRRYMEELRDLGVRGACFNMEVWDPVQFARVCPGKSKFVGRDRWIEALHEAVEVFGPDNVMSAFVGGAELDGEGAFTDVRQAIDSAIEAGETLIPNGIQAVYSLYWRMTGKNRGEEPFYTLDLFLELNEALAAIRAREGRFVNPEFFGKRAAYMQLEPDYDAARHRADAGSA